MGQSVTCILNRRNQPPLIGRLKGFGRQHRVGGSRKLMEQLSQSSVGSIGLGLDSGYLSDVAADFSRFGGTISRGRSLVVQLRDEPIASMKVQVVRFAGSGPGWAGCAIGHG